MVIKAVGDAKTLSAILGVVVALYATYSLATPQIPAPSPRMEVWLSPPVGAVAADSKPMPRSVAAFCRIASVVGRAAT